MSRRKIQRNIQKNLPAYNESRVDTAAVFARIIGRVFAVVIAVSIPMGVFLAGMNFAFKLPDVYSFDLKRTNAAKSMDYADDSSKIADLMSGYMRHNADSFILRAKMGGETVSVFTSNDAEAMEKYRGALDVAFGAMCAFLPLSIIGYLAMAWLGRKTALKYSIRAALVVYLGVVVAFASVVFSESNSASFASDIIGVSHERSDVLPQLFGGGLFAEMFGVIVGMSAIAMILVFALTARLTRGGMMFRSAD